MSSNLKAIYGPGMRVTLTSFFKKVKPSIDHLQQKVQNQGVHCSFLIQIENGGES